MDSLNSNLPEALGYIIKDEQNQIVYHCKRCPMKYTSCCEFQTHASQNCKRGLVDLDVNCTDALFKYLGPNDLAAMGQTCTKFKTETERHFRLHCQTETINIFWYGNAFQTEWQYEKHFTSLIRNVWIDIKDPITEYFFKRIRKDCAKEMLSLALVDDEQQMQHEFHSEIIKDQLENLKKLVLIEIPLSGIHDALLRYCKHLQTLIVILWRVYSDHNDDAWLNKQYSDLETVKIILFDFDLIIDLTNFIRLNPKLKNITYNVTSAISSICRSNFEFERITMIFEYSVEFFNVFNDFVRRCQRKNSEKYELDFNFNNFGGVEFQTVVRIKNVTDVHIYGCSINRFMAEANKSSRCWNIEKLCTAVHFESVDLDKKLTDLEFFFPNLRELIITSSAKNSFETLVMPFVSRFPKLKYLWFMESFFEFGEMDVFSLNRARACLNGASKVIVYLKQDEFEKFELVIRLLNSDNNLVVIRSLLTNTREMYQCYREC